MKILKTKEAQFELNEIEHKEILTFLTSKNRPTHFEFKRNALKASECSIINSEEDSSIGEKKVWEYTDNELRTLWVEQNLGEFEREYNSLCTGARVMNQVLGSTFQPMIDWCSKNGIISKTLNYGKIYWSVCLPNYEEWERKVHIIQECQRRRTEKKKRGEKFENERMKSLIKDVEENRRKVLESNKFFQGEN